MSFDFKNPTSQVLASGPISVSPESNVGTNFSAFQVGGFMEVFNISDLGFSIPSGETGTILYSGNTIPIDFSYNSPLGAPNVINLYSDGISSGRRRLGMLAYVYETDTVYQFTIHNYENLFNSAQTANSLVNIGTGFQCIDDTQAGANFISAWTGNTVEGISGATRASSNWIKYNPEIYLTGGTYTSGNTTLTLYDNTGGTITVTGFTASGGGVNIQNYGTNRLLVSDGTQTGIIAQSGLTFSNGTLNITGSALFSTTYTAATQTAGQLSWNDGDGTLDLTLKGDNTTIQLGQSIVAYCYNDTSTTLNKGEVVYIEGAQGQRVKVARASSTGETSSSVTFGLVMEPILAGQTGFVISQGVLKKINTLGLSGGTALWLGTTPGTYTQIKPQAPNNSVLIGYVERVHQQTGSIYVKIQNGYELEELHNVLITGVTNGDILVYDSSRNLWINTKTLRGNYIVSGTTNFVGTSDTPSIILSANTDSPSPKIEFIGHENSNKFFVGTDSLQNDTFNIGYGTSANTDNYVLTITTGKTIGLNVYNPQYSIDLSGTTRLRGNNISPDNILVTDNNNVITGITVGSGLILSGGSLFTVSHTSGTSGTSGIDGTFGTSGLDGTSGSSGSSGSSGIPLTLIGITGATNGVNSTFIIEQEVGSAHLFFVGGQLQNYGIDYTISGTTLTTTSPPFLNTTLALYTNVTVTTPVVVIDGTSGSSGTSGGSGSAGSSGTSGTGFNTITDPGAYRILASDGTVNSAMALSGLTFSGNVLNVNGKVGIKAYPSDSALYISGATEVDNLINAVGSYGQIFNVRDSLVDTLFSVNDVSGIPALLVDSIGVTKISSFNYLNQSTSFDLFKMPDNPYNSAWVDYFIKSSGSYRAGTLMAAWNYSDDTVIFTDTSTKDVGSTSGFTFSVSIVSNELKFTANISSGLWDIKGGIRVV